MNLQELTTKIESGKIDHSMYDAALAILNAEIQETYTLQEYTALLYVLGAYKEQKGQSVYCGLMIDKALKSNMYKITKEDNNLNEHVDKFRQETLEKVDTVLKVIDKRFINVNLLMSFVLFLVLQFTLRMHFGITLFVCGISFLINFKITLPRTKKKYVENQIQLLRDDLFEEFRVFESEIY